MPQRSRLAVGGGLLAVAALIVVLWWQLNAADRPERTSTPEAPPTADPDAQPHPGAPPDTPSPKDVTAASVRDRDSGSFEIVGSVGYREGGPPPAEFQLDLAIRDGSGWATSTTGRDGRFRSPAPAPGWYVVTNVRVAGEEHGRVSASISVGADGLLAIELERPKGVVVRTKDGSTGAPLAGVQVYAWAAGEEYFRFQQGQELSQGHQLPNSSTVEQLPLMTDSAGKLKLQIRGTTREFCFFKEGYAWSSARIANTPEVSPTTDVSLVPGGSIKLTLLDWSDEGDTRIYVHASEDDAPLTFVRPSAKDNSALVVGLMPGAYRLVVRRGAWYEGGFVMSTARVAVQPGTCTAVAMACTLPKGPRERITGSVLVPDRWKQRPHSCLIVGAERTNSEITEVAHLFVGDGRGLFAFTTRPLPFGSYYAEVVGFQWKTEFAHKNDGRTFDIKLPNPVQLRVRLVSYAERREVVKGARIAWSVKGALVDEPPSRPQLDRRSRRYVLLVPPGDIELRATVKGHLETVSRVRAGGRMPIDLDLFLYKSASVTVRLRSRGAVVPVSVKSVSLTKAGEDDRPRRFLARFNKGIATFDHLEAGVWRLVVEPIPGFTGVLESDVVLADGESADVNIELSELGGGD